jgi:glycosyltransferase involved in cell wall biosynthesis
MRILHIITGLANGGSEGALYRLTTADRSNSHQVIALTDFGLYADRFTAAGIPVHCLAMPRGRVTIQGLRTISRLVRRIRPDVVQTWMYHADLVGGVIARLSGQRVVTWGIHASDAHQHPKGVSSKKVVWLCARLSRIVPARIIFVSQAGSLIHRQMGYRASKSRVIPNGFDTTHLAPDPEAGRRQRVAWNIAPDVKLVGMVARWDPLKDHETLIGALQTCADRAWTCVLIGADMNSANAELAALLHRCGVFEKVKLLGPSTDIRSVMNALDVHVLSSKSEALPSVLVEAMACATPCVATDVGDARLIMGTTGWIVPAADSGAMAHALRQALEEAGDQAAWERRKAACRARVLAHFSLEQMVEAYNIVWKEAAAEHDRR